MKTNSRILRGYNNNQFADRSKERNTAPSAMKYKGKKKNRESTFSKPSLYELPHVYRRNEE